MSEIHEVDGVRITVAQIGSAVNIPRTWTDAQQQEFIKLVLRMLERRRLVLIHEDPMTKRVEIRFTTALPQQVPVP